MPAVIIALVTWALGSFIARVLIGAGLVLLISEGLDAIVTSALNSAVSSLSGGGLPAASFQLALLSGIGSALSIVGAAIVTRISFMAGSRILGVALKQGA